MVTLGKTQEVCLKDKPKSDQADAALSSPRIVHSASKHPEAQRSRGVCADCHRILTVTTFEEASILRVFSQWNEQIPKPDLRMQRGLFMGGPLRANCRLACKRNSKIETRNSKNEIRLLSRDFRISIFEFRFSANRQSLVPQRHHGIDLRRPAGRDVACQ